VSVPWVEYLTSSGIGGAVVAVLHAVARRLNRARMAARVRRAAHAEGGPEYGTIGWVWKTLDARIEASKAETKDALDIIREDLGKARSKGHANEAWCSDNAQRLAACETAIFGAARLQSGEQERIDFQRDRPERRSFPVLPAAINDTEPDPMPAMGRRRSRP